MVKLAESQLKVLSLGVKRNYRTIFQPFSFTLKGGEALYLCGENGIGKSTSLRVLAGVAQRYQGEIWLNEWERREWGDRYGENLLYIGHHLSLKNDLTALANIELLLKVRGVKRSEAEILAVFDHLHIPRHPRPIRYLSAGQRRRVALSRLWLENAFLWILDEPFTSLDWQSIELLEAHFAQHLSAGGLLIFTSHQPPSKKSYTQQITLEAAHD